MEMSQAVLTFLNAKGWFSSKIGHEQVHLIARSENNENYRVTSREEHGDVSYVCRVNHGSRLGLTAQTEYEFAALQALRESGVTPRPFYCDCSDCNGYGNGVLLMEYLPGRHFSYAGDWDLAARVFAAVHSQPVDVRFVAYENSLGDMVRECAGLSDRFAGVRHAQVKAAYQSCLAELQALSEEADTLLEGEAGVMVHGDHCASDFIVADHRGQAWLVDWESCVVSSRYVDLGQFMSQAAQAGEMGFCRDKAEKVRFVEAYIEAAGIDASVEDVMHKAALFAEAGELRAMIWNCVALTGNLEGMG